MAGVQSQEYGTIDRDVVERVTDCQMKELVTIGLFTWLTTERSTYWPAPCFLLMLIRFLIDQRKMHGNAHFNPREKDEYLSQEHRPMPEIAHAQMAQALATQLARGENRRCSDWKMAHLRSYNDSWLQ